MTNPSIKFKLEPQTLEHISKSTRLTKEELYTLTTKESYMHVCRVDNTVLVINTDIKNKETAKELVDKLGY